MPMRPEELEDLASNDPDAPPPPVVERKGPPEEQPEQEPEQEEPGNGGTEREDEDGIPEDPDRVGTAAPVGAVVVKNGGKRLSKKEMEKLAKSNVVGPITAVESERSTFIPIDDITESPTNPRQLFGDLEGLSKSLVKMGFVQDLVVRKNPVEGRPWELVCGARRLRAAKLAKLPAVPCAVRELTDADALQFQLTENIERKSLRPLEEADGLHRMNTDGKLSAEEIGLRVGKSERWVQTRIQLLKLGPEARTALNDEKVDISVAVLLAAVHSHKLQAEAVDVITKADASGEAMSVRAAKQYLKENYSTELRGVAFDRDDDMLVPEAGSCKKCQKRTGNNPEMFSEYKRADVCLDTVCFKSKLDAHWAQQRAKAKEKGYDSVPLAEGRRLFKDKDKLSQTSDFIDLAAPCPRDKRSRTWREVLGDRATDPALVPITVAPDLRGHTHQLVQRDVALDVAKKAGLKWAAGAAEEAQERKPTKEQKERREADAEVQEQVERAVLTKAVEAVEGLPVGSVSAAVLRLMCMGLAQEPHFEVMERRELRQLMDLQSYIEKQTKPNVLLGLLFELAVGTWVKGHGDYTPQLKVMAKLFKVDIEVIEKAASNTAAAEELFDKSKKKGKAKT